MSTLKIFVPLLPPGLNQSYGIGKTDEDKGFLYKTSPASQWAEQAALIIGSEAGIQEWVDDAEYYEIIIKFSNFRQDVDAPLKLVIDTISQKLGFNDKRIMKQCSEKVKLDVPGVQIELNPYG